jgi:hypothetical protein
MLGFALLSSSLNPPTFWRGRHRSVCWRAEGAAGVRPWMQTVTEEWAKNTGSERCRSARRTSFESLLGFKGSIGSAIVEVRIRLVYD